MPDNGQRTNPWQPNSNGGFAPTHAGQAAPTASGAGRSGQQMGNRPIG
jgi:hypothetical protein